MAETKPVIVDRVLFQMPADFEYQLAALGIVQSFIQNYPQKMLVNDPTRGNTTFQLEAEWDLSIQQIEHIQQVGVLPPYPNSCLGGDNARYDMIIDLSDERVAAFDPLPKHLAQLYGNLIGIDTVPLAKVRRVKKGIQWGVLSNDLVYPPGFYLPVYDNAVTGLVDGQVRGLIGHMGWQTYIAAAMGLDCIEIVPKDRPRGFLSKWAAPGYRAVQESNLMSLEEQIYQAIQSLPEPK